MNELEFLKSLTTGFIFVTFNEYSCSFPAFVRFLVVNVILGA